MNTAELIRECEEQLNISFFGSIHAKRLRKLVDIIKLRGRMLSHLKVCQECAESSGCYTQIEMEKEEDKIAKGEG